MTRPIQPKRTGSSRSNPTARALRSAPIVLMAVLAMLLSACGGESGSGGSDELTTIVVWDRAGDQATVKQKWFETWNAGPGAKAGIKVNYEPQAADKYEEIVRVAFQTQRGPDIFHTPSSQLGGFVAAGWVQPLDEIVDQKLLDANKAYLGKHSELVWAGRPYAIPTTLAVNRLVINNELFEQAGLDPADPPETFSELVEASNKIAASDPGKVYGFALTTPWVGFRQWNVDLDVMASEPDLTNGMFNQVTGKYEMTKYADIVEAYRKMIVEESAYPGAATLETDVAANAFAKGEIGMMINSGVIVPTLKALDSQVEFTAAPLPVADGAERVRMPMNAGFPYGISGTTKEPEAAATVLEALVSDELQKALAEGDISPVSPQVWDSPLMEDNAELQKFRPTDLDQQWPKNPNSIVAVEGKNLDQTIVELVLDPELPIDSTLKDLQDRYNQAYQQAVDNGELDPKEFTR
jgi:ABC-type glycerol-3-phosphate transport system substrate-binding protein